MSADSSLVASLVEFYQVEEIRIMWQQVFQARMSRVTSAVTVNASSFEGGSSSGIVLSTPQEMDNFIGACRAALRAKGGDSSTLPEQLGSSVNFGFRPVAV